MVSKRSHQLDTDALAAVGFGQVPSADVDHPLRAFGYQAVAVNPADESDDPSTMIGNPAPILRSLRETRLSVASAPEDGRARDS